MVSSELPEVLGLCDRIVVMRDGRIAGRFDRTEATEETPDGRRGRRRPHARRRCACGGMITSSAAQRSPLPAAA